MALTVRKSEISSDNSGLFSPVDFSEWDGLDYLDLSRSSSCAVNVVIGLAEKRGLQAQPAGIHGLVSKGTLRLELTIGVFVILFKLK